MESADQLLTSVIRKKPVAVPHESGSDLARLLLQSFCTVPIPSLLLLLRHLLSYGSRFLSKLFITQLWSLDLQGRAARPLHLGETSRREQPQGSRTCTFVRTLFFTQNQVLRSCRNWRSASLTELESSSDCSLLAASRRCATLPPSCNVRFLPLPSRRASLGPTWNVPELPMHSA